VLWLGSQGAKQQAAVRGPLQPCRFDESSQTCGSDEFHVRQIDHDLVAPLTDRLEQALSKAIDVAVVDPTAEIHERLSVTFEGSEGQAKVRRRRSRHRTTPCLWRRANATGKWPNRGTLVARRNAHPL
jgi:hypothetical protein